MRPRDPDDVNDDYDPVFDVRVRGRRGREKQQTAEVTDTELALVAFQLTSRRTCCVER